MSESKRDCLHGRGTVAWMCEYKRNVFQLYFLPVIVVKCAADTIVTHTETLPTRIVIRNTEKKGEGHYEVPDQ